YGRSPAAINASASRLKSGASGMSRPYAAAQEEGPLLRAERLAVLLDQPLHVAAHGRRVHARLVAHHGGERWVDGACGTRDLPGPLARHRTSTWRRHAGKPLHVLCSLGKVKWWHDSPPIKPRRAPDADRIERRPYLVALQFLAPVR